jgi:hypothetical protein
MISPHYPFLRSAGTVSPETTGFPFCRLLRVAGNSEPSTTELHADGNITSKLIEQFSSLIPFCLFPPRANKVIPQQSDQSPHESPHSEGNWGNVGHIGAWRLGPIRSPRCLVTKYVLNMKLAL